MSERAQCVITDGRHSEIFYSRRAAPTLDVDLLAGPDAAGRRIRDSYDPDERLREPVWIEAAALIDTSRRLLAIFSWHLEGYAHRAALRAVLAETWPGWDLRWAYAGLDDIAAHSGVPADPAAWTDDRPVSLVVLDPTELDEADALVTVTQQDRTVQGYGLWSDTTDLFWAGPGLLDKLSTATPVTGLPAFPHNGLHLDPAARTAVAWTTQETAGLAADWPRHWPGWRLDFQQDSFASQPAVLLGPAPTLDAGLDILARRLTGDRAVPEAAIDRVRRSAGALPPWPGLISRRRPGGSWTA
ncbi:hypothetical protein Aph02nite_90700 [Actinoplanes philippinensis]|nr:hypothetical protein [Actinoplanes philippinensis]GIE83120.1 hypothetical protein Aph02nite_90700 [Actinoplanes philippinensis]